MAKRTRITIETESLLILRGRTPLRAWCQQCRGETEMVPLGGVGVIFVTGSFAIGLGPETAAAECFSAVHSAITAAKNPAG